MSVEAETVELDTFLGTFDKRNEDLPIAARLDIQVDSSKLLAEFEANRGQFGRSVTTNPDRAGWHKHWIIGKPMKVGIHNLEFYDNSPVFENLTYFQSVLEQIPGTARRAQYAIVPPGAKLKRHTDGKRDLFKRLLRLHIPVVTNPDVWMMLGTKKYRFEPNGVYMLDNFSEHGVLNMHPTESRNHIIVDVAPEPALVAMCKAGSLPPGIDDPEAYELLAPDYTHGDVDGKLGKFSDTVQAED